MGRNGCQSPSGPTVVVESPKMLHISTPEVAQTRPQKVRSRGTWAVRLRELAAESVNCSSGPVVSWGRVRFNMSSWMSCLGRSTFKMVYKFSNSSGYLM